MPIITALCDLIVTLSNSFSHASKIQDLWGFATRSPNSSMRVSTTSAFPILWHRYLSLAMYQARL